MTPSSSPLLADTMLAAEAAVNAAFVEAAHRRARRYEYEDYAKQMAKAIKLWLQLSKGGALLRWAKFCSERVCAESDSCCAKLHRRRLLRREQQHYWQRWCVRAQQRAMTKASKQVDETAPSASVADPHPIDGAPTPPPRTKWEHSHADSGSGGESPPTPPRPQRSGGSLASMARSIANEKAHDRLAAVIRDTHARLERANPAAPTPTSPAQIVAKAASADALAEKLAAVELYVVSASRSLAAVEADHAAALEAHSAELHERHARASQSTEALASALEVELEEQVRKADDVRREHASELRRRTSALHEQHMAAVKDLTEAHAVELRRCRALAVETVVDLEGAGGGSGGDDDEDDDDSADASSSTAAPAERDAVEDMTGIGTGKARRHRSRSARLKEKLEAVVLQQTDPVRQSAPMSIAGIKERLMARRAPPPPAPAPPAAAPPAAAPSGQTSSTGHPSPSSVLEMLTPAQTPVLPDAVKKRSEGGEMGTAPASTGATNEQPPSPPKSLKVSLLSTLRAKRAELAPAPAAVHQALAM